jgi:uncharacterized SAM-binding protein YcdF (DUF218 family)
MFFIFSKILFFITQPLCWITSLLILFYFIKNNKKKKQVFWIAIAGLIIFSNRFICDCCLKLWEVPYVKKEMLRKNYDYGIILGGMSSYSIEYKRVIFGLSADRLFQALELYKEGRIKKIILAGGTGELFRKDMKESAPLKEYLISIGVSKDDIYIDNDSKNTYENARNVKYILRDKIQPRLLLITSAFHMRRAKGCFNREGLNVDIYPADLQSKTFYSPSDFFIPSAESLDKWNLLIKELIGYGAYKIMGYI